MTNNHSELNANNLMNQMQGLRKQGTVKSKQDLTLATAIVLLEIASSDNSVDKFEQSVIHHGLKALFKISDETAANVIVMAKAQLTNMRSSSTEASMLRDVLDPVSKRTMASIIDNLIKCNGVVDGMEIYLRRRFRDLLGIPDEPLAPLKRLATSFFSFSHQTIQFFLIVPNIISRRKCAINVHRYVVLNLASALVVLDNWISRSHHRWVRRLLGWRDSLIIMHRKDQAALKASHPIFFHAYSIMLNPASQLSGIRSSQNINRVLQDLSNSFNKLASGKNINKASDDAAALAIAANLEASLKTMQQASRNVRDVGSALSIADGAVSEIQGISGRLQELAVQSANGTYSDEQRATLQAEYSSLSSEIGRIAATTEFNGVKLLDGSQLTAQVGINSGANSQIATSGIDVGAQLAQLYSQNIGTQEGAQATLSAVQQFSQSLNTARGSVGSTQARLDTIDQNISSQRIGESEALSRIVDLDYAQQSSLNINKQIQATSSVALAAYGNKLNVDLIRSLIS